MYSIAIGGFPHGSLVVLNRQNSPPAHQASSTSGGSLISGLKHSQACRNVLGVCFSQKFHSTAGRGHVVDGFYTLASAGGLRVFRPLCWGPAVRVLRRGIVLGAWVRETRTTVDGRITRHQNGVPATLKSYIEILQFLCYVDVVHQ